MSLGSRVVILTNALAPSRIPLYEAIGKRFDTWVLTGQPESNRKGWQADLGASSPVKIRKSWGWVWERKSGVKEGIFDRRYFQMTPGYAIDLWRLSPSLIITNEMGFRSLVALAYGWLFGRSVWVWWGGTSHTEKGRSWAKRQLRSLFVKWTSRWISYGASSSGYLSQVGVAPGRILQIQNCVDETAFEAAGERRDRRGKRPTFLCVGQLIGRKGVGLLLEAAKDLQGEGLEFDLVFAGDGPQRKAYEDYVLAAGLRGIRFLGGRGPGDLPAIYRDADWLVFPTLEDVWGLVVNEALWSRLPVLGSIFAGCSGEILPKENIFNPLDRESFTAILRRALKGEIAKADTKALLRSDAVGNILVREIKREFRKKGGLGAGGSELGLPSGAGRQREEAMASS